MLTKARRRVRASDMRLGSLAERCIRHGGDCDHLNLGVSQKNFLDLGRVVFDTTRIDHILDIVSDLSTGMLDSGYLPYWISRYSTDRFVVPLPGEPTRSTDCSTASTGHRPE